MLMVMKYYGGEKEGAGKGRGGGGVKRKMEARLDVCMYV
jgi:hypothetical protein